MWLAINRGLSLHSSTIQSEEAKAVWRKMYQSKKYPIKKLMYQSKKYPIKKLLSFELDYYSDLKWRLVAHKTLKELNSVLTLKD